MLEEAKEEARVNTKLAALQKRLADAEMKWIMADKARMEAEKRAEAGGGGGSAGSAGPTTPTASDGAPVVATSEEKKEEDKSDDQKALLDESTK